VLLSQLPVGKTGEVVAITCSGLVRRRLLDLGLVPGTKIRTLRQSPGGDPLAFNIRGAVIALRLDTASHVKIRSLD
jgi:ferrous iron transport protein A